MCDRLVASEKAGDCAAGKRGEKSVALFEARVLLPVGALGARRKLVALCLLPRDWASTRPSDAALNRELEW